MKKTTPPNRKLGRMLAKNLIVLAVVVLAAVIGSWSWFTTSSKAEASDIKVEALKSDGIEIAVVPHGAAAPSMNDSSAWHEGTIELTRENYPNLYENLFLCDIDGGQLNSSGNIIFKKPFMLQSGLIARPNMEKFSEWPDATANTDYLSVDVYIRTAASSEFEGAQINETSTLAPETAISSTFTPDVVIGALRFSYISKTKTTQKTKIWIPAPNVHYDDTNNVKTVSTNYTASNTFTLPSGITGNGFTHYYYITSGVTAYPAANTIAGSNYQLGVDDDFLYFDKTSSGYRYGMTTCNMWIAGEDSETRLATVGGNFDIKLDFTAY